MEEKATYCCAVFLFAACGFFIGAAQFVWAVLFFVAGVMTMSLREIRMEFKEINKRWDKI